MSGDGRSRVAGTGGRAIALSLLTVFLQRQQHQRDAYRQMYETLMSEDLHRGRWLVNEISATTVVPEEEEVFLVFRTLGTFDTLAMYVRHGVIPRRWVMDVWHHPLREMRAGAEIAQAHRIHPRSLAPAVRWPQLWELIDEAETYISDLACCDPRGSRNAVLTVTGRGWRRTAPALICSRGRGTRDHAADSVLDGGTWER